MLIAEIIVETTFHNSKTKQLKNLNIRINLDKYYLILITKYMSYYIRLYKTHTSIKDNTFLIQQ